MAKGKNSRVIFFVFREIKKDQNRMRMDRKLLELSFLINSDFIIYLGEEDIVNGITVSYMKFYFTFLRSQQLVF